MALTFPHWDSAAWACPSLMDLPLNRNLSAFFAAIWNSEELFLIPPRSPGLTPMKSYYDVSSPPCPPLASFSPPHFWSPSTLLPPTAPPIPPQNHPPPAAPT